MGCGLMEAFGHSLKHGHIDLLFDPLFTNVKWSKALAIHPYRYDYISELFLALVLNSIFLCHFFSSSLITTM